MQESAAGAAGAIDELFGEALIVVAVVVLRVADHVDEAGPSAAQADDFVAFAQCANGDGADGRIEAGNIAASGKNADYASSAVAACHDENLI